MVDSVKMDKEMQELIKVRNQLSKMDYSNEEYDTLEESLHDMEDDFIEEFGDHLEEVLHNVHDEYCPDNDVLLPIAYIAKNYTVSDDNLFDVDNKAGIYVDADDFPGKNTRLVMIPNPVRIVMLLGDSRETLWTQDK